MRHLFRDTWIVVCSSRLPKHSCGTALFLIALQIMWWPKKLVSALKSTSINKIAQRRSMWIAPAFFSKITQRLDWYWLKEIPIIKTSCVNHACRWAILGEVAMDLECPKRKPEYKKWFIVLSLSRAIALQKTQT